MKTLTRLAAVATTIWWLSAGGETATSTDSALFIGAIVATIIIAIFCDSKK